ncbi:cell wall-binding repeat-containing protein [Buchananella hordeovulneris]|uniref:cell wall-binding repeat-containing protein n=1 Tax=Buchananella hordeovulneris TaxID=52770 RepID=UPI0026DCCB62|nr:cell wall-binding repeat-containing protein [Buchananella hordeovulneris]MDO5080898.1 cell wall-binding repeat-containing protein [Buchananella hordeovulneris]
MKLRMRIGACVAFCLAGVLGAASAQANDNLLQVTERIAGGNRYDTAVQVSRQVAPNGSPAVLLASGEGFADALGASGVANYLRLPVLLTGKGSLPPQVREEIARLQAVEVVIVGGEGSISAGVAAEVAALTDHVTRVAGSNRYRTSEELVKFMYQMQPQDAEANLVLASGRDFPDALTVVPLAHQRSAPLLLVDGKATQLSAEAEAIIGQINPGTVYIVGGPGTVSTEIEQSLPEVNVLRLAGNNRYETSLAVFREFGPAQQAVMVSGATYPDALVGGTLAGRRNQPLLAVNPICLGANTVQTLTGQGVRMVSVVGGQATLSDTVASGRPCGN